MLVNIQIEPFIIIAYCFFTLEVEPARVHVREYPVCMHHSHMMFILPLRVELRFMFVNILCAPFIVSVLAETVPDIRGGTKT